MRIRSEPFWTTARGILPSCDTWHSTSCRRMAQRRRCAASFSEPGGTTPISLASSPCSEVRLTCSYWFLGGWNASTEQAYRSRSEQSFAATAGVMHELKETEIQRQFVLRDAAV